MVIVLFFIVLFFICIVVYINSNRSKITITKNDGVSIVVSKKEMRNGAVFSDNFGEKESEFQVLLRCHGATIMRILASLIFLGVAIYMWSYFAP